jgi:hypothetical protein
MLKNIKNAFSFFKENKELKKENNKLKQAILALDPKFNVIPYLQILDIQKWRTANKEILPVQMGYFEYSIKEIKSFVFHYPNRENLYICLRKITSEQMNEIEARNFIYSLFIVLEIADDIPTLEANFQKIIINKNMEAMKKYSVSR